MARGKEGTMAKKQDDLAKRRERLPEVGGLLHLEHVNFEVADHEMATIFFMNGRETAITLPQDVKLRFLKCLS